MDSAELVANIVRSLAWPAVVVVIVLVLRKQINTLLARQNDAAYAHEQKKKFEQFLKEGRQYAEWLGAGIEPSKTGEPATERPAVARDSPITALLLAYQDVLDILLVAKRQLDLPGDSPPPQVITALVKRRHMSERAQELFLSLTQARNTAIHCSEKEPITQGEATDYRQQTEVLTSMVRGALERPDSPAAV
jgi:hypothetical protein